MRSCLECRYFHFNCGAQAYSKFTPGYTATCACDFVPSHWDVDMEGDSEQEFRQKLLTADTCQDFAPVEPEPVRPDRVGPILPIARGVLGTKGGTP